MKQTVAITFTLLLLLSLFGCSKPQTQTAVTTQPQKSSQAQQQSQPVKIDNSSNEILIQRREQAEAYMRKMATVLWRASEDITYSNYTYSTDPLQDAMNYRIHIKAGRLYRGLPYTHFAGDAASFLEYAGEADEQNIYTVSGLTWHPLNGSTNTARVGNDCASAVGLAWGSLGNSLVSDCSTKYMTIKNGYLRVGDYKSDSEAHTYTYPVCLENGGDVMFAAYAKLQKADGLVRRNANDTNGHAMMVVSVYVHRKDDGSIDAASSYVTVLEQTSGLIEKEQFYYDETLGENVYKTYIIDKKYTFLDLFGQGYLPITCKELIDPTPAPNPAVTDSESNHNYDTLLTGTLKATRFISAVSITITDSSDNILQSCSASPVNRDLYTFDLQTFVTDRPEVLRGTIDPDSIPEGNYHCTVICRLITGETFTVRDFNFTK